MGLEPNHTGNSRLVDLHVHLAPQLSVYPSDRMPTVDPFRCRSCSEPVHALVLDLGEQPASDVFPAAADDPADEERWPLRACVCESCWLVQLAPVDGIVPQAPLATESATSQRLAHSGVESLIQRTGLGPSSTVIELTSHHGGSWLPTLEERGLVIAERDQAQLVVDVHALAHEEDIDGSLASYAQRLTSDGWVALEFHHLLPLIVDAQFDTVRHGHPVYLSVLALQPALSRNGLDAVDAVVSPAFGGSVLLLARPSATRSRPTSALTRLIAQERAAGLDSVDALQLVQAKADESASALRSYLELAAAEGRTVLGYGAPSKAPIRLCYADIGPDLLAMTADLSPAKHGRRLPGCGIPITSPQELLAAGPDEVMILTWDISREVVDQLTAAGAAEVAFSVPAPLPRRVK